ncbi:MAG TPA: hypothetical protein VFL95_01780 [Gemmatimonadales bacterium]|nr:hypothetical protein [Gemmatimonadales bacterium]
MKPFRIVLLLVVAALPIGAPAARAQSPLPHDCYTANRRLFTSGGRMSPAEARTRDQRLSARVLEILHLYRAPGEQARRDSALGELWRADTGATAYALALLLVNDRWRTPEESLTYFDILRAYRKFSGRGWPVLEALGNTSGLYRSDAIRALRPPLTPAEAETVFAFGCDAAWVLRAAESDSAFTAATAGTLRYLNNAGGDLRAAACALAGPRRDELDQAARQLTAKYGGWNDDPHCSTGPLHGG